MNITNELIAQKIYDFITYTLPEREKNASYYRTDQPVNKGRIIQGRPNNILRTNICKYITDVHTGYFMGVPLTLDFNDDVLGGTFVKNMPRDLLYELLFSLSRDMSIYGTAFCLVYTKNGSVAVSKQSPERAFSITDDSLGHEVVASVRFPLWIKMKSEAKSMCRAADMTLFTLTRRLPCRHLCLLSMTAFLLSSFRITRTNAAISSRFYR